MALELSKSVRSGYSLDTNAGTGNNNGIKVQMTVSGLTDAQIITKFQAEVNRNVQEYCRLISGTAYQNALKNPNTKNPERLRPTSEQKILWTKWCAERTGSLDLVKITRSNTTVASESMDAELARRLAAGDSIDIIVADIKRRAEEAASLLRTDASDTVQTGEETEEFAVEASVFANELTAEEAAETLELTGNSED